MNYNRGCYNQPPLFAGNAGKKYSDFHTPPVCKLSNSILNKCDDKISDTNSKLGMVYSPYQDWQNICSCLILVLYGCSL